MTTCYCCVRFNKS